VTKLKGLDNFKRAMAFVLTLIIITTSVPMNVLATETELDEHNHDHELVLASSTDDALNITEKLVIEHADMVVEEEGLVEINDQDLVVPEEEPATTSDAIVETTEEVIESVTESALLVEVKADMNAILEEFGIEVGMTEDEIYQAITSYQGSQNPFVMIEELENKASNLNEEGLASLEKHDSMEAFELFVNTLNRIYNPMLAKTLTDVLNGSINITDTANRCTYSNGTVTITAKGSLISKGTNNITIVNISIAHFNQAVKFIIEVFHFYPSRISHLLKQTIVRIILICSDRSAFDRDGCFISKRIIRIQMIILGIKKSYIDYR